MKHPSRRRRGPRPKDKRPPINIAATVEYRGDDELLLTFVFRGAPKPLVERVFSFLLGAGNGIAQQALVYEEHDVIHRPGKGYYRIAVELSSPNFFFCSVPSMQVLIEAVFHRLHPCSVTWMSPGRFLNV